MSYRLKIKKTLLIFYSMAITSSSIFFNSSAMLCGKENIDMFNITPEWSNRPIVITNQPSRSNYIKKNVDMRPSSKIIVLDKPGDYVLTGAACSSKPESTNELVVNSKDSIVISSFGKYNITLNNVNIDTKNKEIPITILNEATVSLILKGKNTLQSKARYGIFSANSKLTVTECAEGGSLDIIDQKNGIYVGKIIEINSGAINLDSEGTGVRADYIEINGGVINSNSQIIGMECHYLIMNGGTANLNGEINGIECSQLEIKGGDIKSVGQENGIFVKNRFQMNGGIITTKGAESGISVDNIKMDDGEINATSEGSAVKLCNGMELNGGTVNLNGGETGICVEERLEINGGIINSTAQITGVDSPYLIINEGLINSNGQINGIRCSQLKIKGGVVNSIGGWLGICAGNRLQAVGGEINARGGENGISVDDIKMSGGTINLDGGNTGTCAEKELEINGGAFTSTGKIYGIKVKTLNVSDGVVTSTGDKNGICVADDLKIDGGSVNANSILANITITGGELLTKNINGVIWNYRIIKKTEKIFGVFDDERSLIGCRKNDTDRYAKIIGYTAEFNDPTTNKNKYLFIENGSINGIAFPHNNNDCKMKGGNNFVTESNHHNYNDLELFFE